MPSNPRSIRISLAVAGLLVASLVVVLWMSFTEREGQPPATGRLLNRAAESPAQTQVPEPPELPLAAPDGRQALEAPVVAMGPDMIIVRVIDSETRAPVTAFEVDILPHDGTPPLPRTTDPLARTENSVKVRDPAGVFKAERKAGRWDVVVRAPTYLPGVAQDLAVPPADARPVAIVLSHGPSITGLVYDDDGLPVQDVPVFLAVERLDTDEAPPRATVCRTGTDGRFRFSPLPPGAYGLALLEPGNRNERLGNIVVQQGATDVNLYLAPRHNVVISVQDRAGRPVTGADVELRGDQGIASARTQESGRAHLRYVADGTYALSISGSGFQRLQEELVLTGGQGEQVRWFTLQPAPGG